MGKTLGLSKKGEEAKDFVLLHFNNKDNSRVFQGCLFSSSHPSALRASSTAPSLHCTPDTFPPAVLPPFHDRPEFLDG